MGNLTTFEIYQLQYPNSDLSEALFNSLVPVVSTAIETYLDRNLQSQTYQEYHDGFRDTVLITRQWPVTKIYGIYQDFTQYAQINITSADNALTFRNNVAGSVIEYIVDLATEYSYDYSSDADISTFITNLSAGLTGNGITQTTTVNSRYSGVSPKLLKEELRLSSGKPAVLDFNGVDLDSQINFVLQGDRDVILSDRSRHYSDEIYIKYTAGYTLPSGSSYGNLPRDIIDSANRIIRELGKYDSDETFNAIIKSEKLGDASYTLQDNSDARSYVAGLVELFGPQLARYRRYDIIRV